MTCGKYEKILTNPHSSTSLVLNKGTKLKAKFPYGQTRRDSLFANKFGDAANRGIKTSITRSGSLPPND